MADGLRVPRPQRRVRGFESQCQRWYSDGRRPPDSQSLTPADPDLLPGQTDVAAPDGPNNEINTGYLWNNALRAGLTVRDYGFFIDTLATTRPPTSFLWRATRSQPGPFRPSPPMSPSLHTPIRTSAGSITRYPDFYRYCGVAARVQFQLRQRRPARADPGSLHARSHRKLCCGNWRLSASRD